MNTPADEGTHNLRYAEYVLGVLDADARAEVAHEVMVSDEAATAVALWQRRLLPLAETVAEVTPFRAKRYVGSSLNNAAPDAQYWSAHMAAVSVQRDRASFMRIYDHFTPRAQRHLCNLGVPESIADELVPEALLTLWRKAALFDPARTSLSTWLYRVARNLYIDHVRKVPHWLPVQGGPDRLDHTEADRRVSQPESFIEQDLLQQTIDLLPAVQPKLVRMGYLESKSHSEIARELDMPLGAMSRRNIGR